MPKLADLMQFFPDRLGVPATTVEKHVKPLRSAKMLTTTGARGVHAPEITARDAATVTLSCLVGQPTKAVEAVTAYGDMVPCVGEDHPYLYTLGLPYRHTFLDAITRILDLGAKDKRGSALLWAINDFFVELGDVYVGDHKFVEDEPENTGELGENVVDISHYASFYIRRGVMVGFIDFTCIANGLDIDGRSIRYLPRSVFDPATRGEPEPSFGSDGSLFTISAEAGPGVIGALGGFLRGESDGGSE